MAYRLDNSFGCFSSNSMANHFRHLRYCVTLVFMYVVLAAGLAPIANAPNNKAANVDPPVSAVPAGSVVSSNEPSISGSEMEISRAMDGLLILVMDKRSFQRLSESLLLSEAQQRYADDLYESYRLQIDSLRMYFDRELRPLAAEFLHIAPNERKDHPELLLVAAQAVEDVMRHAKPKMNLALRTLEAQALEILADSQQSRWREGMRTWRRSVMLNSGTSTGGAARDLGRHIDLIELISDICDDHAALYEWLCQDVDGDGTNQEALAFHQNLDELLVNYAIELDSLLQSQFWRSWDEALKARTKAIAGDQKAMQRAIVASIQRWMRIYRLNDRSAGTITALLADAADEPAAAHWREVFARVYFPQMYAEKSADFASRWLLQPDRLNLDQQDAIREQYEIFLHSRLILRRNMKQELLKIVTDESMMPGLIGLHRMIGDLPQLDEINARRRDLNQRTIDIFRQFLSPIQDEELTRALKRFHRDGIDGEAIEF